MPSSLDNSLDEILAMRNRAVHRGGNKAAVAGGIRKRPQRAAAEMFGPSGNVAACKIIVSNLPYDVTEKMIEEYFQFVAGPIRRAALVYGPDGRSRGVAIVEFTNPERATLVARKYDGIKIDERPMKVELVVGSTIPANFADRVCGRNYGTRRKTQKYKAVDKSAWKTADTRGRGGARGGIGGGSGSGGLPMVKTTEGLDQEMAACFGGPGIEDSVFGSVMSVA